MAENLDHIITLLCALLGAWMIVWQSKKRNSGAAEAEEIADRAQFRTDLMKQVADLRVELARRHQQLVEATEELIALKKENLSQTRRIDELERELDALQAQVNGK